MLAFDIRSAWRIGWVDGEMGGRDTLQLVRKAVHAIKAMLTQEL